MKKGRLYLLAVSLVLVALVIFDVMKADHDEKQKELQSLVWPSQPDYTDVTSVVVVSQNQFLKLERVNNQWMMSFSEKPGGFSPLMDATTYNDDQTIKDVALDSSVENFIEGLLTEKSKETATDNEKPDPAVFGLDKPIGHIQLTYQGKAHKLLISGMKNFEGDSFIRVDDQDKILVASSLWKSKIDKKPIELRDRRWMRLPEADIESISFNQSQQKITLSHVGNQWKLGDFKWDFDQNKIRDWVHMFNGSEVLNFMAVSSDVKLPKEVSAQIRELNLKKENTEVQVNLKNNIVWKARLYTDPKTNRKFLETIGDRVALVEVSGLDFSRLQKADIAEFRDRKKAFIVHSVTAADIKKGEQTIQVKTPTDLANKIMSLEGVDFMGESKPAAFKTAEVSLSFTQKDSTTPVTIEISPAIKSEKNDIRLVKSSLEKEYITISDKDWKNVGIDDYN